MHTSPVKRRPTTLSYGASTSKWRRCDRCDVLKLYHKPTCKKYNSAKSELIQTKLGRMVMCHNWNIDENFSFDCLPAAPTWRHCICFVCQCVYNLLYLSGFDFTAFCIKWNVLSKTECSDRNPKFVLIWCSARKRKVLFASLQPFGVWIAHLDCRHVVDVPFGVTNSGGPNGEAEI